MDIKDSEAPISDGNVDVINSQELETHNKHMENIPIEKTFLQGFYELNLPKKKYVDKKKKRGANNRRNKRDKSTTTFDESKPSHMVQTINLSNYRGLVRLFLIFFKEFTKSSFREFLECIVDMRCLSTLIVANNGIDDTFDDELGIFK